MTRDELTARDEALLEEARQAAEAVIDGAPAVYLPFWGRQYNPYLLLGTATDPGVFRLALVNIRKAFHREESWEKCANCARLYLCGAYGNTCSPECFAAYSNFLDNPFPGH
jgi:hypothetical protein